MGNRESRAANAPRGGEHHRQRAPPGFYVAALQEAAQDDRTFLHRLPRLGPLQMIEQYLRHDRIRAGVVPLLTGASGDGGGGGDMALSSATTTNSPATASSSSTSRSADSSSFPTAVPHRPFTQLSGIIALDSGEFIVCNVQRAGIHLLGRDLRYIRSFGECLVVSPYDLCEDFDGNIAVADAHSHSFHLFSAQTFKHIFSFVVRKEPTAPVFMYPISVVVNSFGEYVVTAVWGGGCDDTEGGVFMFDRQGKHIRCVDTAAAAATAISSTASSSSSPSASSSLPEHPGRQLFQPGSLTLTSDDNVVVVDAAQHRLLLFDRLLQCLRSIDSVGCSFPGVSPTLVAADAHDKLVVAVDADRQRLFLLTSEGVAVREILTPSGESFTTIRVARDGRVLACTSRQIFVLQ